jgi:hypothetical protein
VLAGAETLLGSGRVAALIFERGRSYDTAEGAARLAGLVERLTGRGLALWRMPHENMGGPLVPWAPTRDLCNVFALPAGFPRRPDYAKPFGTCPAPFRLPRQPEEAELVAATEARMAARTPDVDRWAVPERSPATGLRAAAAADELVGMTSVLDLGAGAGLLRDRLEPGCRYLPVDLFRFAPDMAIMDLERAALAPLGRHDAATLLAVLEYLHDPARILAALREIAGRVVLTYPLAGPADPPRARRRRGIVNDLELSGLEALAVAAGWRLVPCRPLPDGATLVRLEPA